MYQRLRTFLFVGPGLAWLTFFMVVPCLLVFVYSFFERGVYGGIVYEFTFENFDRAFDALYLAILLKSAKIAGLATLIALLTPTRRPMPSPAPRHSASRSTCSSSCCRSGATT